MICKDCRPVFYAPPELPRNASLRETVKHVELCERHAEMEAREEMLGALVANVEAEVRERRRLALLQCAATIIMYDRDEGYDYAASVDHAEKLLAEIEKRETNR
jgi:hypothetical protein